MTVHAPSSDTSRAGSLATPRVAPRQPSVLPALCILALSALQTLPSPAAASPGSTVIHRCGNSYSHEPCSGGRVIAAEDALSPDRRREAERVARGEQALVTRWARERAALQREAGSGLASLGPPAATGPRREARQTRVGRSETAARAPQARSTLHTTGRKRSAQVDTTSDDPTGAPAAAAAQGSDSGKRSRAPGRPG